MFSKMYSIQFYIALYFGVPINELFARYITPSLTKEIT